jgi:DNA-binding NtrC family response regulator
MTALFDGGSVNDEYTILLVDDQRDVRSALRRALFLPGYTIHEANGGAEALEILRAGPIDAVVSDYDMPGIDGMSLLQRVRLQYPATVRILVTGRADLNLAVRALNEGAVHRFFLKPWNNVDLRGIVQMALHQNGAGSAAGRASP